MVAVSESTSTNTGTAPVAQTAAAVGTAVKAGTITSSPGPMPSATNGSRNASVPDDTPTACARPVYVLSSDSNSASSGPNRYAPDRTTRDTASVSSGSSAAA